jgi:hypothetical protein
MTDPISTYEDGSRWKDVTLDPAGYSSLLDLTERPVVSTHPACHIKVDKFYVAKKYRPGICQVKWVPPETRIDAYKFIRV